MTDPRFSFHDVGASPGGARALAITADSAVWCVDGSAAVLRRSVDGELSRFDLGQATAEPRSVAAATRDSVWVTDRGTDRILRLDPSGVVWSTRAPTAHAGLAGIVGLDDGSAWFVEERADAIGRVDILGRVTEFAPGAVGGEPSSIASDGTSVWFGLPGARAIAYARGGDSQPGLVRFDDPLAAPTDVSVGDDGCLWFADPGRGVIGRLDRGGEVTEFALAEGLRPIRVGADPRGGCWFTMLHRASIGRVDGDGRIATVDIPGDRGAPVAMASASSGDLWLALERGDLARFADPGDPADGIQ
ncbi:hypothetical protein QCD70_01470 [Agreia sp. PsM10]|uniref:Vgb family protein n=1 Tax=Agreia sp. PsM10 TaxID=3030533 RepID=UPI00263ACABD|nr:hypothetical protein [Agreia sp. PsM10]MDN4638902.1 hypothetical protein [Agreia sp. PsM10]